VAEEIDNGRIVISKDEVRTPILVSTANFIQVPTFSTDPLERVYVSRHGDMTKTWVGFTQETNLYIEPPFYVHTKYPCTIPCMEM